MRLISLPVLVLFWAQALPLAQEGVPLGPGTLRRPDQLAFVAPHQGHLQIHLVNADGTGLRRLTDPPGHSEGPVWSPDGQSIAFMKSQDEDVQIYIMRADGRELRRLTGLPGMHLFPAWSPDGRRLVYVTREGGSSQIYMMNADGTASRQMTSQPGENTVPVWSPGGRRIAFVSRKGPEAVNLYVMPASGSGRPQLLATGLLLQPGMLHPEWSPDGWQIAFVSRVGRAERQISVIGVDGGSRRRLASGYAAAWSPDGERVAFVVARVGDAQIYVASADRSSVVRLTPSGVNLLADLVAGRAAHRLHLQPRR